MRAIRGCKFKIGDKVRIWNMTDPVERKVMYVVTGFQTVNKKEFVQINRLVNPDGAGFLLLAKDLEKKE